MAEEASEAAVLFADVSGSTKLYESAGNAVAHAAVESCVNLMKQKTQAAKGRVIKTIGDEVMSAFTSADDAADAAIEMQLAISELPPVGTTTLGIRIGFNFGPVVERDGDVFGDAVNLAARLAARRDQGPDHHRARHRDADVADAEGQHARDHHHPGQGQGAGDPGLRADVAAERGHDHARLPQVGLQAAEHHAAAEGPGRGAGAVLGAAVARAWDATSPPTWW